MRDLVPSLLPSVPSIGPSALDPFLISGYFETALSGWKQKELNSANTLVAIVLVDYDGMGGQSEFPLRAVPRENIRLKNETATKRNIVGRVGNDSTDDDHD
jgi:hypothetical protein